MWFYTHFRYQLCAKLHIFCTWTKYSPFFLALFPHWRCGFKNLWYIYPLSFPVVFLILQTGARVQFGRVSRRLPRSYPVTTSPRSTILSSSATVSRFTNGMLSSNSLCFDNGWMSILLVALFKQSNVHFAQSRSIRSSISSWTCITEAMASIAVWLACVIGVWRNSSLSAKTGTPLRFLSFGRLW